jgi:hypothetical protein
MMHCDIVQLYVTQKVFKCVTKIKESNIVKETMLVKLRPHEALCIVSS